MECPSGEAPQLLAIPTMRPLGRLPDSWNNATSVQFITRQQYHGTPGKMSMKFTQADLDKANRHVIEGESQVLKQKQVIEKLRRLGATTAQAEKLLASYENMLQYHRERRDRIAAEFVGRN